jgi:hypothetical protein
LDANAARASSVSRKTFVSLTTDICTVEDHAKTVASDGRDELARSLRTVANAASLFNDYEKHGDFRTPKGAADPLTPDDGGVYLIRASEIVPEHVEYLDDPLIPVRVVTLVVGVDGVGKSTVLYHKGARATRGTLPGSRYGEPVPVVIASSEDHPESVIVPRLMAAGAYLDLVHIVRVHRDGLDGDLSLPDDLDELSDRVRAVQAGFLIVDPLVAHMPTNVDTHKAQHIRLVLAPLARLAEECQLAVAAVVHFNGSPSTDVRTRISGSKALRDASRSVIVCGRDPEDETRFVMVQDKNSFGPRATTGNAYRLEGATVEHGAERYDTSTVVWLGQVEIDSRGLLQGPRDNDDTKDAASVLEGILADGPVLVRDALKEMTEAGFSHDQAKRARVKLGAQSVKFGKPGDPETGWKWVLPEECTEECVSASLHPSHPSHPSTPTSTYDNHAESPFDSVTALVHQLDATITEGELL